MHHFPKEENESSILRNENQDGLEQVLNDDELTTEEKCAFVLMALKHADEIERQFLAIADHSIEGIAEVMFVEGRLFPSDVLDPINPPPPRECTEFNGVYYLQLCLNVLSHELVGVLILHLTAASGASLFSERVEIALHPPDWQQRRPKPIGIISVLFAVPAALKFAEVATCRVSFVESK